jgi:zinc protease
MMRRCLPYGLVIAAILLFAGCVAEKSVVKHPDKLQFQPIEFSFPKVERFVTLNGIRVYFKEDRELPLVSITAVMGGGFLEDPDDKVGLGDLFGVVLRTGGAGAHSADELDELLETMGADLEVETDTYATSLSLSVRTADLENGLAVLNDLLRSPRFDEQRLELARKKAIEEIRRRNDFPRTIAHRSLGRWLYQGHPLGRESTISSTKKVTREDLFAVHRRCFLPNNMWLAVSGDLSKEDLQKLLTKVFGDWPSVEMKTVPIPQLPEKPEPVLLLTRKDFPQTNILMGARGIEKSAPDLAAVQVMNFILGGGGFNSRLMREIRSNRGLAYSIYSYFQIGRRLPGLFLIGGETKSESTFEVVNLVREIMSQMRTTEVTEEELRLAKESLVNSFVFAFTDSHSVVARELRLDFYDYPEGYLETYRDRIASVTASDVLAAARRHLDPAELTVALVGDESRFDAPTASLGLKVRPGIEEETNSK